MDSMDSGRNGKPRRAHSSKKEEAVRFSATSKPTLANRTVKTVHSSFPPPVEPAMQQNLPSQADRRKFRIVLVGNCGVGKSSLIKSLCKVDPDQIDVAHGRRGRADIEREYTSEKSRFILHDSNGFEAGSKGDRDTIENFIRSRWKRDFPDRIDAIWFCVKTPLRGARLLQTGDERVLQLAEGFNIPIIAVFTKYDVLVTEYWRQHNQLGKLKQQRDEDAEKNALHSFDRSAKELQEQWKSARLSIPCVKVSTTNLPNMPKTLVDLEDKTREMLRDV